MTCPASEAGDGYCLSVSCSSIPFFSHNILAVTCTSKRCSDG